MAPHRHVSYKMNRVAHPPPHFQPWSQARRIPRLIQRLAKGASSPGIWLRLTRPRKARREFWLTLLPQHATLDAMKADPALLNAALVGYQSRLTEINQAISEIRRELAPTGEAKPVPAKRARRKMSRASRQRIAAAQRKRWAEYKKARGGK